MTSPFPSPRPESSAKKLLKEHPSQSEMVAIIKSLLRQGDKAIVLIGTAYVEHALEELLKGHFRPLTKDENNRMFDGNAGGVLGSFSAKIRIAYSMKLMHRNVFHIMLLINDIRNTFAHSLHKVSFTTPAVMRDCDRLVKISGALAAVSKVSPEDKPAKIFARIIQTLCRSLQINLEDLTSGREEVP